jgi:hypothetical protein
LKSTPFMQSIDSTELASALKRLLPSSNVLTFFRSHLVNGSKSCIRLRTNVIYFLQKLSN